MKIPEAEASLRSDSRIPNTDTGGDMIGRAMAGFGNMLADVGSGLDAAFKRQQAEREQKNRFDADIFLKTYQESTQTVPQQAQLQGGYRGEGMFAAAKTQLDTTKSTLNVPGYIENLRKQGDNDTADWLQANIGLVDMRIGNDVKQGQFKESHAVDTMHIEESATATAGNATADPAQNDIALNRLFSLIDNAPTLTPAQKLEYKSKARSATLAQELRARTVGDPHLAAQLTGQNDPAVNIKQSIWQQATAAGVDPEAALTVAFLESRFNPDAVNPASGAKGLFQIVPGRAGELGGTELHHGIENLRRNQEQFFATTGRMPTLADWQFMQLGQNGAPNLAKIVDENPNMPLVDAMKQAGWDNAWQVIGANPKLFPNSQATVGQAYDHMQMVMEGEARSALGGDYQSATGKLTGGALPQQGQSYEGVKTASGRPVIEWALGPARPNKPQAYITDNAARVVQATNPNWTIRVTSGGGEHGSDRHRKENGYRAADIQVLDENGKPMTMATHPQQMLQVYKNLAAAGYKGIGNYGPNDPMIHIDDVRVTAWGPGGTRKNLDPALAAAIQEGRAQGGTLTDYTFAGRNQADPRYDSLAPAQRQAVLTYAAETRNAASAQATQDWNETYKNHTGQYDLQLATAPDTMSTENILADPLLTSQDKARYVTALQGKTESTLAFSNAAKTQGETGTPIDMTNNDVRKGADAAFTKAVGGEAQVATVFQQPATQQAMQGWMAQHRIVPDRVIDSFNSALATGQTKNVETLVEMIGAIQSEGGSAALLRNRDNTGKLADAYDRYQELVSLNVADPGAMVAQELAQERDPEFQKMMKARRETPDFQKTVTTLADPKTLDAQTVNLGGVDVSMSELEPTSPLRGLWASEAKRWFERTGDKDGAISHANYILKTQHVQSAVMSNEPDAKPVAMINSPALFFPPVPRLDPPGFWGGPVQSDHSYIDRQVTPLAKQFLKDGTPFGEFADNPDLNVWIEADNNTEAVARMFRGGKTGVKPSYSVWVSAPGMLPMPLPGLRYTPDPDAATGEYKAALAARRAADNPPAPPGGGYVPGETGGALADQIVRDRSNPTLRGGNAPTAPAAAPTSPATATGGAEPSLMDQMVKTLQDNPSSMPPNPLTGQGAPRGTANRNVTKEKPPTGGGRGGSR